MSNLLVAFTGLAARVLLAQLFVLSGPGKIAQAAATASFMATGGLPNSPVLAVVVGLFEVLAGLALLLGVQARWAAIALALFTAAASLFFHAYWSSPPEQQFVQQLLFSKNLGVIGGLLAVAAFGPGAWSWDDRPSARSARLDRSLA